MRGSGVRGRAFSPQAARPSLKTRTPSPPRTGERGEREAALPMICHTLSLCYTAGGEVR
jgi:hypothetical protein